MTVDNVKDLFMFVGGLGLFLYGMNTMADGLQKSASGKMKKLLGYLTKNRLLAVVFGALITAIIQSSSATTVMVVGFVNAGLMNLVQAVGVIMGANIGTTATAWIVSLNDVGTFLKPEFIAPLLVGIGAIMNMFVKKQKKKDVGTILLGFGLLFIGLSFMSDSISAYRDAQVFKTVFRVLGQNPILGILAGAGVTAIIQSSSASVGILQTLAINGVVNWRSAIFITLGQNIGTCVTALISSAGAGKEAKRAATIHLMFNVFGAVLFGFIMYFVFLLDRTWAVSTISSYQISIFHTIFNVSNTIILFPFAKVLVHLSERLIRDKNKEISTQTEAEGIIKALDDRILENPTFAIETAIREVGQMGDIALRSAKKATQALLENDTDAIANVFATENTINELEKVLTDYLVKVDNLSLNEEQHFLIKNLLYTVHDLERVGDHCENIVELAQQKVNESLSFSDLAIGDMNVIIQEVLTSLEQALCARQTMDFECVRQVVRSEDKVDMLEDELREKHIERLSEHNCQTESGLIFLDMLTNLERISDHAYNIAGYVKSEL